MSFDMAAVEYPFTMSDKDRHGNVRWYVRMEMPDKTRPKIRIKNKHVGSAEWVEEKNQHIETLKRRALGLPDKADSPKKRKSPPPPPSETDRRGGRDKILVGIRQNQYNLQNPFGNA